MASKGKKPRAMWDSELIDIWADIIKEFDGKLIMREGGNSAHTRPSPRPALEVQPKIDMKLEGSELCLEKEAEPTATTKKAIETVICGSWVGSAGAEHCMRVSDG